MYDWRVQIDTGRRVRIRVNLAIDGGEPIETNVVEYIQGDGKMLRGLEAVLQGLESGAKKAGVLTAKEAFGNPAFSPHKQMKRAEFPHEARIEVGERFTAKGINGVDVVLAIDKIVGDDVDVRLLHPLGDKDIRYDVEVLSVTDPLPPPVPAEALALEEADRDADS